MNWIKILNKTEKNHIEKKLSEQYGSDSIEGELAIRGKDKIFLFSGGFNSDDLKRLAKAIFIERIGVYFAKEDERMGGIRLSIEGSQILKNKLKKNVFELNHEQTEEWMQGKELRIKTGKKGFLIMKSGDNFLGTGKASEEKIGNFIPKNRRLKESLA
ncbi:MAG: hypothetical protein WDZ77_01710 [Candidatus Pacearchaeota archaeon]